jgi:sec-independent protein translocase protein TatB
MLDVGFSEILLTSAIALIVLGPERLPKVARQVGNWMGRARAMARQLSEQLEREVSAEELLKTQSKPNSIAPPQFTPSQLAAAAPPGVPADVSESPVPASSAVPDAAVSDAAVSDAAVPDAAVPDAAVPDVAVPDVAAPYVAAAPGGATPASTPEPTYGLAASATTAAAMHASDAKVAGSKPPHE